MKFQIDKEYLIRCFEELVSVPSPVGYREQLLPVLERYAAEFGCTLTSDRRGTVYLTLEGEEVLKDDEFLKLLSKLNDLTEKITEKVAR